MAKSSTRRDSDDGMALRAAWLYYTAGLTQADIADRLGVTNVKVHRLIARASEQGAVKVRIEGDITECIGLENALSERYKLTSCEVVTDLYEDGIPLKALGAAGAVYLERSIEAHQGGVIGVGHGRTLASAVSAMARVDAGAVRFVSLLGGVTRNFEANPHDVIHRLVEKTGAAGYVMPVPFFANSIEDREVLMSQRGIKDVVNIASHADLMIVGIGNVEPGAQLVSSQMIEPAEIQEVKALGGVGELLGHFFGADGRSIETPLTSRTISLELGVLKGRKIVAIAGGNEKACAIRSVLMSGYLSGLITDERTARALTQES